MLAVSTFPYKLVRCKIRHLQGDAILVAKVRRKEVSCYIFHGIKMFLCDCCLSQLPNMLCVSTAYLNDGILVECISVFWEFRLAWCSVSGVYRILYLRLARPLQVILTLPQPPSIPPIPLPTPPSLSLHAWRRAVLLPEALLLGVRLFLPWLLRPGQCLHLTLPLPCKLLTASPPAVLSHLGHWYAR